MYEFIDYTWNAVKGLCPHGCSYCYMRRWGSQPPLHFDARELKTDFGTGNHIFVGSSCDLFAEKIPYEWIDEVITKCWQNDRNHYFFQSKNPGRMLENLSIIDRFSSVCTTLETNRFYSDFMQYAPPPAERAAAMRGYSGPMPKYVTIEPIISFDLPAFVSMVLSTGAVQVNIGADSGRNGLPEPSRDDVLALAEALRPHMRVVLKKDIYRIIGKK